jgi:hypothetical protein
MTNDTTNATTVKENVPDKLSSVSQTIKDVAAAYNFDITYGEDLDRIYVKSRGGDFWWDDSYDMNDFWNTLEDYFRR